MNLSFSGHPVRSEFASDNLAAVYFRRVGGIRRRLKDRVGFCRRFDSLAPGLLFPRIPRYGAWWWKA